MSLPLAVGSVPTVNDPMSIVMCIPRGEPLRDPNPEQTEKRDISLVDSWDGHTGGVVGWSTGGWDALEIAAAHPDLPRLVIAAVPFPDEEPQLIDLDSVAAKTLLLFGSADPLTGAKHGQRWQKRLPNAQLEMVPGGGHELLVPMWFRILSHLAPRRTAGRT